MYKIISKFMKKYITNIITGSRIVFSLPLLLIPLTSARFYALYLLCGLSDMIDRRYCGKKDGERK